MDIQLFVIAPTPANLFVLMAAWVAYFALHSALASLTVKGWVARLWPGVMPFYRLLFNAVATLLVLPLSLATFFSGAPALWHWSGWAGALADGLALAAAGGFLWTARCYSMPEFLGLRRWRQGDRRVEEGERFCISVLHRHVRHPWYTLGLIILWSRDMDLFRLSGTLLITVYLFAGAWLEERKLLAFYGERYRRYCERVPGIIPRPWRHLTRAEAQTLAGPADGEGR